MKVLKFNLDETGFGKVTLDGQSLECRSISVRSTAGELSDVVVRMLVKVDGEVMMEDFSSDGPKPMSSEPAASIEGLKIEFDTSAAEASLDRLQKRIEKIIELAEVARAAGVDLTLPA